MLANITSTIFHNLLFSHIFKNKELDIVKYNKNFQEKLGLSLKHYKIMSKKFIIYEKKNYGKEYLGVSGNLLYEGEFINGRRNGKGKEYDIQGQLIYEGDYKNGKKEGIGILYTNDNVPIYEGEFKNGKRNGKGKTFKEGKIYFDGEFFNDGLYKGKIYKNDKVIYELEENGIRKEYNNYGGVVFEGEYLNWKKNGKGKEYDEKGKLVFNGEYLNGKKNGIGTEYLYDFNLLYKGKFLDDKRHGNGMLCSSKGDIIMEGDYFYGRQWNIKLYDENGKVIHEIKNGKGISVMKIIHPFGEGIDYKGEFVGGLPNGKGKEIKDRKIIYEGEFLNGLRNGKGKENNEEGEVQFVGEFLYDEKFKGREYYNGSLVFEGEFLYGKHFDGKIFDKDNGEVVYELKNGNGKDK